MRNWLLGLAAAGTLATAVPASAQGYENGYQYVVDFDSLDVGTGGFTFFAFGFFENTIYGGTVTPGSATYPPVSGSNVYIGTEMGFYLGDPFNYCWPAVSAFVTGSMPITMRLFIYDYDSASEVEVYSFTTPGDVVNFNLGLGDSDHPGVFTSAVFTSKATFSIDDLKLGLPDVGFGVPEPATWAMLIGGFGLTGAALRRRRVAGLAGT